MNKVLVDRELLPCPFCGGEARLDQRTTQSLWNSSDAVFSHVACDECDISGQDFCDDPNGEEASEWWNRRAQPAEAEAVDVRKIVVDSLVSMIAGVTRMIPPTDQPLPDFIQAPVDRAVERISAALPAVTAERDRLQAALDDPGYQPKHARRLIAQLRAELKQSRDAYQHMIDQTTPLEPVPGDPRWSKRIELDEVIAERDRLDAECGRLLEGKIQDAETIYILEAEQDQLRAEAEALRKAFMRMRNVAAGYSNCCEFDSANTRRLEREFEAADELFRSSAAMAAKESTHEE